jgi:protein-tyrosine phosphatase
MHELCSGLLWIGNAGDILELQSVFDAGIRAIIDVAYEEAVSSVPRQLVYCRFPLNDGGGNDRKVILNALHTATNLLRSGIPTIIACSAGMSRSPTIAAFALASLQSQDPETMIQRIGEIRSLELNPELWSDVRNVWESLCSGDENGDA